MSIVTNYLKTLSEEDRLVLLHVKEMIERLVPDAQEVITYGMPGYKYKGKYLISFSAFKDHLSIFPGAEPIEVFNEELKSFVTSKGTIQFTPQQQIPDELLEKIILKCAERIKG